MLGIGQVVSKKKARRSELYKKIGLEGFEPSLTEPKSAVLPLHHRPVFEELARPDMWSGDLQRRIDNARDTRVQEKK